MDSLQLILSNRAFFSPAWVFASLNILTGTWVLYLPYIKTKFEIDDSQIGIALFCLALGLLVSIPFIPTINRKIGLGRSTKIGILLYALFFNLPLITPNYLTLCLSLFVIGILSGFTDISMNALVSTIEKKEKKPFMSAAHGFFSLGGFIGASVGSLLIAMLANPVVHMMVVSIFIILTNLYFSKYYHKVDDPSSNKATKKARLTHFKPLIGLAFLAFLIMFNEGATEHWSNLFLFNVVQVSESQAGLGFIAFSLCMTVGRFLGDGISKRIGSLNIISVGCIVAFIGYFFIVLSNLMLSVFGFGLLGLGLSVVIPEIYRLAGQIEGIPASSGISMVSGIGFVGFLIGPVVLGFVSDWTSLIWSFYFLSFTMLLVLLLLGYRYYFKGWK